MTHPASEDRLLTPEEVAAYFRVGVDTALRWGRQKRLRSVLTPGGGRRFPESAVRSYLNELSTGATPDA